MVDTLIMVLSTTGAIFILIAAYGILRMPDFYLRLSVTIKAATMGVGCLMISAALYFTEFSITTKVFAIVFFLFITAPVAGHMIARTAYITGIQLWKKTVIDELEGQYNKRTHNLRSNPECRIEDEKPTPTNGQETDMQNNQPC